MMKNFLFIFLFFCGTWVIAQDESNPFNTEETKNEQNEIQQKEVITSGPGNPDDDDDPEPIPIDNNLSLLLITAIGLIIYQTQKNKKLSNRLKL